MTAHGVSLRDKIMVWGRAAHRCAICRKELMIDGSLEGTASLIGEVAHIVGESPDGPRGESDMPLEARNRYPNLLLLCRDHHKEVDDLVADYPVERLHEIKRAHEEWVRTALSVDYSEQRALERYAEYVDKIVEACGAPTEFNAWTSHLQSPSPSIEERRYEALIELNTYLIGRIWPRRHPRLESAMHNLRHVINDFIVTLNEHLESGRHDGVMRVAEFYRIDDWNEDRYHSLVREHGWYVDLVADYVLELARALNLLADRVRDDVDPNFLVREGAFLMTRGPDMSLSWSTFRVEYRHAERAADRPYPGAKDFLKVRATRDRSIGSGERAEEDDE